MFVLGTADWSDKGLLHDIDLKCFDDVWTHEYWLYWLNDDTKVVFLVKDEVNGPAVGMAVCVLNQGGLVIEKLCVKVQYRRKGVSRMLLNAVKSLLIQYETDVPIYLVIPETWMYEGYSGYLNGLTDWVSRVGLKAEGVILPGYFCVNGETLDGIRFIIESGCEMAEKKKKEKEKEKKKKVPLCWSCNSRVYYGDNGWVCYGCGQHGKPDVIQDNWEDGILHNTPYMGEE